MSAAERSGWRDLDFSNHRRRWGDDVPCTNIDSFGLHDSEDGQQCFNLVEYDRMCPRVLIEYKHYLGENLSSYLQSANGTAMTNLANSANLPFLAVTYWPVTWAMHVVRANEIARRVFFRDGYMSEFEFVSGLYRQRNRPVPEHVAAILNRSRPVIQGGGS